MSSSSIQLHTFELLDHNGTAIRRFESTCVAAAAELAIAWLMRGVGVPSEHQPCGRNVERVDALPFELRFDDDEKRFYLKWVHPWG